MPTKFYCENECVKNHADELTSIGTNALIVTGRGSSRKNHSLDDVIEVLSTNNIQYTIFDGVEENPSVETVMKAREAGIKAGVDFVIGIGGGSPLDAAKAIALMIKNGDKEWDFLYDDIIAEALPVVAVPTTCGTGSEVTGVAVLTRHDKKTKISMKHKIFPELALIDGKYIMQAPKQIIINTAIDALAHLVESIINTKADYYSMLNAIGGISLWRSCREFMESSSAVLDKATALRLMEASTIAGISIAQTGTSIPHALSYMLTYEAGIPHGPAVGLFLARYLEGADPAKKNDILEAAGFKDINEFSEFLEKAVPLKVERGLLERSAQRVLENTAKLKNCPYDMDRMKLWWIAGIDQLQNG